MAIESYKRKNKIINSIAATTAEAKKCPYLILANIHAAFMRLQLFTEIHFAVVYKVFIRK